MIISIDTAKPFTDHEKDVLKNVLEILLQMPGSYSAQIVEKMGVKETPAVQAAPDPAPPADPGVSEPPAAEPTAEGTEVTLEQAVAAASAALGAGKTAEVKKVLASLGAKRVSELKPEQYAAFVEGLPA